MSRSRTNVWVQRFPDRSNLVLQWFDPDTGRRRSQSSETPDAELAEKKRADLEYELNHGKYQEPSKLDWSGFRQLFESEYLPGVRDRTREKYNTVLDVFEAIVRPTRLRAITERTISLFLKGMRERPRRGGKVGLAPMTMKNYLIAVKVALGWAVKQKLLPEVPTFPEVKVPKKKPQPVAQTDFDKLLAAAPNDLWRTYLLCGWWGGLRLSEAKHLHWTRSEEYPWVDRELDRIVLPAVFAKSAEDQWVPIHPILRTAIEKLPRTGDEVFPFISKKTKQPLTRSGVTAYVRHLAKRAGVPLSMHSLRKGFGCRVATKLGKGNAPILHRLMRHSSMQITMDYYASVDDALHEALSGL